MWCRFYCGQETRALLDKQVSRKGLHAGHGAAQLVADRGALSHD